MLLYHSYGFFRAFCGTLLTTDAGILIHRMNLFQFSAYGLGGAYFGTDGAANAFLSFDPGNLANPGFGIQDALGGANRGTKSAVDAFIIVDAG